LFLDPDKLQEVSPAEVLDAAARGHLGLDHRFLHALLDRPEEARPAVLHFAERDRSSDVVDLAPEIVALLRAWKTPEAVRFLVRYLAEDLEQVPDEVVEGLVEAGLAALEPLLKLYDELEESESGEVAFVLANLGVRDERILKKLLERLEFDLSDASMLLGMYGDPAALPALKDVLNELPESEADLREEVTDAIALISEEPSKSKEPDEPFDIWALYPETADLPVDLLNEDERAEFLQHPVAAARAAAAASFFNQDLTAAEREVMLKLAQEDGSPSVRARAWEALMNSTSEPEVVEPMLQALRSGNTTVEERGGLLVGLAPEADRNEVRKAILDLYAAPEGRAKALEAMWRSMHPSFRDYFAKHLEDDDLEVRRGAVWGVGYYGLRSEMDRVRKLFDREELRSDALFAYALIMPGDVSRGRIKSLLNRIAKDALGLSEMEEELVKAALEERLMLAGKEPVFTQERD
jgi:hypothetical protein